MIFPWFTGHRAQALHLQSQTTIHLCVSLSGRGARSECTGFLELHSLKALVGAMNE